jgi:hypothetical protein
VRRPLALLIVTGLMAGTVAYAASSGPLTVLGGEKERPLTFNKKGQSESATLTLILRNSAGNGGTLTMRFVDSDGNEATVTNNVTALAAPKPQATSGTTTTTKKTESSRNPNALTVRLLPPPTPPTLEIGRHDALQLRIRFQRTLPANGKPKAVSGSLIVAVTGTATGGPLVVPVMLSEKAAPNTDLKFAQDKATISLTRLFGPVSDFFPDCTKCIAGESVDVGTRGLTPATATATINSETGGSATLELERENGAGSHLSVTRLDRHGSYDGKLVLDPDAEKPRSLAVTVEARDFIVWPLGAILLGALLGAGVLKRHEVTRNRDLVQAMIQDSVNPYLVARKEPNGQEQRPERFYLNGLLPTDASPVYPEKSGCNNAGSLATVPNLYCKAAKLDGTQSLADLLPEVTDVTARFDRWRKVEAAIAALKRTLASLPNNSKHDCMRRDVADVVVRGNLEPDDDKTASDLVLVLHAEAAAAAAYRQARDLYENHTTKDWRDEHKNVDPDKDLDGYEAAPTRTVANAEKVALTLLYKVAALKEPSRIPKDTDSSGQKKHTRDLMQTFGTREAMSYLSSEDEEVFATAQSIPPNNVDTRTPAQIRAQVRRSDWTIFLISAVLTALVYLAGKYSADWGSWDDYLFAFAAGAVAPTVITWSLTPYSRSYRPQAAATPAPAGE